jgi:hypothetical protein
MSSERPIIFSGPMVRAILHGRKTQTRRVVHGGGPVALGDAVKRCPYWADTLWVRETIRLKERWNDGREDRVVSVYCADDEPTLADAWPWKREVLPSIHCPRGLSRITLRVTAVRVERLQEISEDDAVAEGLIGATVDDPHYPTSGRWVTARERYELLWDSINAKRAPWASNPFVWVVSFEVL